MLKTVTNTKNCQLGIFFEFFVVYKNVWLKFLRPILRKLEIAFISDVFQNFQPFSKKSCLKLLGYDFLFLYHNHSTVLITVLITLMEREINFCLITVLYILLITLMEREINFCLLLKGIHTKKPKRLNFADKSFKSVYAFT